ncbi:MAG: DegT/DnrJ/EryC1/StrS family aminotransferase [Pseudomonadales bacterium]
MFARHLLRGSVPPVGEPILFHGESPPLEKLFPQGYGYQLLNSGTAALAMALAIAAGRSGRSHGEVILPAYGCPDLIAAADFVGLEPVLVDIQGENSRYNLDRLDAAIGENTVAIVAVNFLGIHENLAALRSLVEHRAITLIEDNAQFFPICSSDEQMTGDLIVLSFGRGKPISQVGGGALLANADFIEDLDLYTARLGYERQSKSRWRLKARLFNLVLQPALYRLMKLLPFLHIGETKYHQLEAALRMDTWRHYYLAMNIRHYQKRQRDLQRTLAKLLKSCPGGIVDLPNATACSTNVLLRYPLLCDTQQRRDRLYQYLLDEGIGASLMYQKPLAQIEGVPHQFSQGYPGADSFAARVLTLPLTSYVTETHVEAIASGLRQSI